MIKDFKEKSQDNVMAAIVAFVTVFALTFQYYFSKFISPETPLIKIGEINFQHIEFVSILFVISMFIGLIISTFLLKEKIFKLVPICIAVLGFIAIFIGMFTVDFFQKLAPTMRISHVIMIASRLNAIIIAVSGLFVGVIFNTVIGHSKRVFHSMVIALILSTFAYALNAFSIIYIVLGVAIVILGVAYGYIGINNDCVKSPIKIKTMPNKIIDKISLFSKGGIITYFYIYGYYYFKNTLSLSPIVFAVTAISCGLLWLMFSKITLHIYAKIICGIIVLSLFIATVCMPITSLLIISLLLGASLLGMCSNKESNEKFSAIYICFGAIVLGIIAIVINHYLAKVTVFSSNRIVSEPSIYGLLILLGLISVVAVIDYIKCLFKDKNSDIIKLTENN